MVSFAKVLGLLCLVLAASYGLPAQQEDGGAADILASVDKVLEQKEDISIADGLTIVKTGDASVGSEPVSAPRALSGDDSVESVLLNRAQRFLSSHTLKLDIKGSEIVDTFKAAARSFDEVVGYDSDDENMVEESRGKQKKLARILGPILGALVLKSAIVAKLALAGIALIAGKALLVGKLALILSVLIGVKKLLGQKQVSYEVVAHPHHSHEVVGGYGDIGGGYGGASSGHGGWGRSLEEQLNQQQNQPQQQLAYRGH